MNQIIQIEFINSSLVRIECGAGLEASEFLLKNARHLDRVSFGDRASTNFALHPSRIPEFVAHAGNPGIKVVEVVG